LATGSTAPKRGSSGHRSGPTNGLANRAWFNSNEDAANEFLAKAVKALPTIYLRQRWAAEEKKPLDGIKSRRYATRSEESAKHGAAGTVPGRLNLTRRRKLTKPRRLKDDSKAPYIQLLREAAIFTPTRRSIVRRWRGLFRGLLKTRHPADRPAAIFLARSASQRHSTAEQLGSGQP
jgi:hypothetical protein